MPTRPAKGSSASEILPGVFVGRWSDAERFEGTRICVLDDAPEGPLPAEALIPVYDPSADRPRLPELDRIAQLADDARRRGEPVLFFCGHGIRRGALAGAWYVHRREGVPFDAAFERVRKVRPRVEHPRDWMGSWPSDDAR